jgi:hypothetical protein
MHELAYDLAVPVEADSVDPPIVQYGGGTTAVHFITSDARWGRLTFERLDSLRVSRGEYDPYRHARDDSSGWNWAKTISPSAWLQERYAYEKKSYGAAYNFGGNVDEMLDEYSHYVFSFHDEIVEAIAAGIWFEVDDELLGERDLAPDHPARGLAEFAPAEQFVAHGITCHVRVSPYSQAELDHRAELWSQSIFEFAAELDGEVGSTHWTLTYRRNRGIAKSYLRSYFGNPVATYDGVPELAIIRPRVEQWLREVRERRHKKGTR